MRLDQKVTFTIAQADPWQPYANGNKKPPVVDEASDFGFNIICIVLIVIAIKSLRDNRKR